MRRCPTARLGHPIIALAAVTAPLASLLDLLRLLGSVGKIVAILALLPPWILLYLVTGREGTKKPGRSPSSARSATSPASCRLRSISVPICLM